MRTTLEIIDATTNGHPVRTVNVSNEHDRFGATIRLDSPEEIDAAISEVESKFGAASAGDLQEAIMKEAEASPAEPWPDPQELPSGLPPVMPFDFELLPESLRPWIADISNRMQCPPDFCAATAIIVAGSLIGRKVAIRPKKHDDWQVVPNLFGMNIGRPSVMKTPAQAEATKPLARMEIAAAANYAALVKEFEAAALVGEVTKKIRKEEVKKAVKAGGDAQAIAEGIADAETRQPVRRRYMVNDTTTEKLGMILADNPNGVLICCDEVIGLLKSMDKEGRECDRAFYLVAWSGLTRYSYDRVARGTLDIEAAIVSIVGSIQPAVLTDYLRDAVRGGRGDDGLMPRFQMSVYPDVPAEWHNVDRYPDTDAKELAYKALTHLDELTPASIDAERDNFDRSAVPFLRFDTFAQTDFDAWRMQLENRLRSGEEHPAIESHLAKFRSLIPSLSLILHLLDGRSGAIGHDIVGKAIRWGEYLESHARRIYACVTESSAVAARLLATRIQAGDVANNFGTRDIYRRGWTGLDKESTCDAIDALLSLHWLEEREEPTATKSRTRYAINPKIVTDKTDKSKSVRNVGTPIGEYEKCTSLKDGGDNE